MMIAASHRLAIFADAKTERVFLRQIKNKTKKKSKKKEKKKVIKETSPPRRKKKEKISILL